MRPEIMVTRTDKADGTTRTVRFHHAVDGLHATTGLDLNEIETTLVNGETVENDFAYYQIED